MENVRGRFSVWHQEAPNKLHDNRDMTSSKRKKEVERLNVLVEKLQVSLSFVLFFFKLTGDVVFYFKTSLLKYQSVFPPKNPALFPAKISTIFSRLKWLAHFPAIFYFRAIIVFHPPRMKRRSTGSTLREWWPGSGRRRTTGSSADLLSMSFCPLFLKLFFFSPWI